MPAIVLAWLVGEGLLVYRDYKKNHRPPLPGELLASSGVFAVLGLLAEAPNARFIAGAMAWGFDIAIFYQLAPSLPGNTKTKPKVTTV
jgi:hypothetical protein